MIFFPDFEIRRRAIRDRDIATLQMPEIVKEQDEIDNRFFEKRVAKEFKVEFDEALNRELPNAFCKLLCSKSKIEQEKLLKEQSLDPSILFTLILKAYRDYGYTFSRYITERYPKDVDFSKLPLLYEIKSDETIETIGDTNLTNGRLKQLLEQRKVVVANFFDKGNSWHCFFVTYRSLAGQETWNNGQPHFHYLSDKWNLSRDDVIASIKKGKYPSTSIHIGIENYKR
jgi:hypothetical protein